ncbi:hypothetical protein AB0G02_33745, partial [Actinosynnema sp. NPDC023658]
RQHVLVADALAWALHLNGRDEEALTFADRAASTGWHNAVFLYHRGVILAGLGHKTGWPPSNACGTASRPCPRSARPSCCWSGRA